jgi:hypothetical protein
LQVLEALTLLQDIELQHIIVSAQISTAENLSLHWLGPHKQLTVKADLQVKMEIRFVESPEESGKSGRSMT